MTTPVFEDTPDGRLQRLAYSMGVRAPVCIERKPTPPPTASSSVVYFAREAGDRGKIKIGHTIAAPRSRLTALQVGNSRRLELLAVVPGGVELEHKLHARFLGLRLDGEWFAPGRELLEFIDTVALCADAWSTTRWPT